ncbi:MAG: carboxypeptidase regulatory-like domain-containing protein [Saprospiraceae bacterium]|nr:carboxypeptidase regulatory-like domain-containing protein [Saprospiraceae bacterium]
MNLFTILRSALTLLLLSVAVSASYAQGVTTSSLSGQVTETTGEVLIGATVKAVHVPSGTVYGSATNTEGYFRIPYMKVGGPYTVTVAYTGYQEYVQENVYLTLGQSVTMNMKLSGSDVQLQGVEVVSNRNDIFDGNADGQKTVIDERTINNTPTLSRSIADFARLNPLANIGENADGFTISLAGQNNRYNTIYVDGAVNNDVFGLSGSGTNGGQTGVQPISLDAIEQFTVAVAPFDIRQSGFAGGAINAVTRSGTNEIEGSAYYLFRNENLAGKTPGLDLEDDQRSKLADFSAQTYGARIGGPIVKDKVFFFLNAEIQRDETPNPFDFNNYLGATTADTLELIRERFDELYGYDIGTYDNNTSFLNSEKFLAKIDWNINQRHRLSIRHSLVHADNLEARRSNANAINFLNGSETFVSTTNSSALEWSALFTDNLSNKLTIGATFVRDDRDPDGNPFPSVTIQDGPNGNINLGAETFSTANLLNQDVITITNDVTLYKGRHSALFGVNLEMYDAGNLFIRDNYGAYNFNNNTTTGETGVQRFLSGQPASRYSHSFSQVDNVVGDDSEAIAEFKQTLLGIYLQDEYQATPNLKLTGGLRVDLPFWPTDVPVNQDFNDNDVPVLDSVWDLQGARTGQFVKTQVMFSPRLSFNWDINGKKMNQLRGGIGVFTSRIPLVWPGGAYNNYGLNISSVSRNNVAIQPDVNLQPVAFDAMGNPILDVDLNNPRPGGQIDLFAEDFKLPQVMKLDLAYDRKLPWGLIGTVEGIFSKTIQDVRYQNVNLQQPTRFLTGAGPDDRPLFEGTDPGFGDKVLAPKYNYIMLASNTDKGYSWNAVASLSKNFTNGFSGMLSYSYGESYSLFDLTSSQNNSQWRGYYNVPGRNLESDPARSTFSPGHRIFGQFGYGIEYLKHMRSNLSFNFNAQTGGYYTYVVGANNFNFVDDGGFNNNELVFVPESQDQIPLVNLTYKGQTYTPDQQWALLDKYISDHDELNDRRGDYVERNSGKEPMEFVIDLRFTQDFYLDMANGKRNTLQFTFDIFNFTNFLNQEWGLRRQVGSFQSYNLLTLRNNTTGANTTPQYSINPDLIDGVEAWEGNGRLDDNGLRSSRWQMQVGIRYIFE